MRKTIAKVGLAALLQLMVMPGISPAQANQVKDAAIACSSGVEAVDRVSTSVSSAVSTSVITVCGSSSS